MSLSIYDRWGSLTVTGESRQNITKTDGAVTETYTETCYQLKCACGKEFDVWKSEFPGKRKMRDCGCGMSQPGPHTVKQAREQGATGRKALKTVYLDMPVIDQIEEYARKNSLSFNRATAELVSIGLASI